MHHIPFFYFPEYLTVFQLDIVLLNIRYNAKIKQKGLRRSHF